MADDEKTPEVPDTSTTDEAADSARRGAWHRAR